MINYFKESKFTLMSVIIASLVVVLGTYTIWFGDGTEYSVSANTALNILLFIPLTALLIGVITDIKNYK